MKKIHETDIEAKVIAGKIGAVDAFDVITESITAGVRIVRENSDVPTRIHSHPEHQILYVIEGRASITNTVFTLELEPGDFVLLDPNEEHYVITGDEEVKVFEIKYP
ncbi:cupin domain-containing protein [Candidatus Thorarchaeota archaeon]|nr:MAG: cupin domain-containing protein [Candidatus Thorarchaeota archaeon]